MASFTLMVLEKMSLENSQNHHKIPKIYPPMQQQIYFLPNPRTTATQICSQLPLHRLPIQLTNLNFTTPPHHTFTLVIFRYHWTEQWQWNFRVISSVLDLKTQFLPSAKQRKKTAAALDWTWTIMIRLKWFLQNERRLRSGEKSIAIRDVLRGDMKCEFNSSPSQDLCEFCGLIKKRSVVTLHVNLLIN